MKQDYTGNIADKGEVNLDLINSAEELCLSLNEASIYTSISISDRGEH